MFAFDLSHCRIKSVIQPRRYKIDIPPNEEAPLVWRLGLYSRKAYDALQEVMMKVHRAKYLGKYHIPFINANIVPNFDSYISPEVHGLSEEDLKDNRYKILKWIGISSDGELQLYIDNGAFGITREPNEWLSCFRQYFNVYESNFLHDGHINEVRRLYNYLFGGGDLNKFEDLIGVPYDPFQQEIYNEMHRKREKTRKYFWNKLTGYPEDYVRSHIENQANEMYKMYEKAVDMLYK